MADIEKIVKVKMAEPGYDGVAGKMRKDGVYEFPQEQAIRYVRSGVAKPAPSGAKLAKDEDREALRLERRERDSAYELDQEMSAAWDIDVRDLERAELEAEDAEDAAKAATEAVKRAQNARKVTEKAPESVEPGPVHTQGPVSNR